MKLTLVVTHSPPFCRFQQEMTKNAGLINNLNMEQERLLEMLSKVKETNFKRVPETAA
jgi:hypothetical protein